MLELNKRVFALYLENVVFFYIAVAQWAEKQDME